MSVDDFDPTVACGMCGREILLSQAYKVESEIGGPGAHLQQFVICNKHTITVTLDLDDCLYSEVEVELTDLSDNGIGQVDRVPVFEGDEEDPDKPGQMIWLCSSGYEYILVDILREQGYEVSEE